MRLLITGAFSPSEEQLNILRQGNELVIMPDERGELPCPASTIEGVICNGLFLYHDIEEFTSLKLIQLTSAGLDRVPIEKIKEKGISLFNAGGVYSLPMAEWALTGVLCLYKQVRCFLRNQDSKKWEKQRQIFELFGKSALVIGCGSVGRECARLFSQIGCTVRGVDLFPCECEPFEKISPVSALYSELEQADVVILALPLTEETRHIIDKNALAHTKKGAVLVNISRGGVLNTEALIDTLKGHLGGAVLDVFESEPLDLGSPLWEMDNVIITPHNSFIGEENGERLFNLIVKNLENGK